MKFLTFKIFFFLILPFMLSLSIGCDGNHSSRKRKKVRTSSEFSKKTSNVGVGDVADYATGITQLTAKQKSEKKLKKLYSKQNKDIKKLLKNAE